MFMFNIRQRRDLALQVQTKDREGQMERKYFLSARTPTACLRVVGHDERIGNVFDAMNVSSKITTINQMGP